MTGRGVTACNHGMMAAVETTEMSMRFSRCALAATLASLSIVAVAQTAGSAPAPETKAVTTPSGLIYRSIKEGGGVSPTASDNVKVHYRGTLMDGKEFDSSYKRDQPAVFPLSRVIPCWTEGVQRMKPGGKALLTCPPSIAYGAAGAGGGLIPPNATLQFEIELLEVVRR
jgi:FKBP-type peptidyl-prolyl cis-trans isomerase FkpA